MSEQPAPYREALIAAVRGLAAPADEQIGSLRRLGSYPDELAREFDDWARLARGERDELGELAIDLIDRLDAQLAAMSGGHNAQLWTPQALLTSRKWQDVRILAAELRAALGDEGDCPCPLPPAPVTTAIIPSRPDKPRRKQGGS